MYIGQIVNTLNKWSGNKHSVKISGVVIIVIIIVVPFCILNTKGQKSIIICTH